MAPAESAELGRHLANAAATAGASGAPKQAF